MNVRSRANNRMELHNISRNGNVLMRGNQSLNSAKTQNNLFDYLFSAVSILLLSNNFWQIIANIFPQSIIFSDQIIIETLQSAILALGFVGIAVKWEIATKILSRFFILLFGAALAIFSVFWSQAPAISLHQALNFTLLIAFSLALALRFGLARLSILAVSIAMFSAIGQFILLIGKYNLIEDLLFKNGELAFLLIASVWAGFANKKLQILFAPIALFCAMLGVFAQDILVFGAIFSMISAWLMVYIYNKSQNVEIGIAGSISIIMFIGALFILVWGENAANILSNLYSEFNMKTILGQGFAIGNNSIAGYFGTGLGFLGLIYGLLFLFFCLAIISIKARSHKYISIIIFGFFTMAFLGINIFPIISLPIVFLIASIGASFNSIKR